jgi:hypothetical protein
MPEPIHVNIDFAGIHETAHRWVRRTAVFHGLGINVARDLKLVSENTLDAQRRVVGSESFQEEIGSKVGRRLIGETRGRPKGVIRLEIVL